MKPRVTKNGDEYFVNGRKVKVKQTHLRFVGFVGNWVLKVDCSVASTSSVCYYQTRNEKKIWKEIKKADRKYFAPILWSGKLWDSEARLWRDWIIQKRIRGSSQIRLKTEDILCRLDRDYYIVDISWEWCADLDIQDCHNFLVRSNGDPVIYDWGIARGKKKKPRTLKAGA